MRTVREILDEMKALTALIDTEERALTDEEVERYEALETELQAAQRSVAIRARQTAYETPAVDPSVSAVVYAGAPSEEDTTLERAFADWARTGHENADVVELRAQSEGTGSAGGYLVPATMMNRMTDRMKAFGGLIRVVDVLNTSSGETISWPTLDDTSNEGEVVAENSAPASGADLTFGKNQLAAYRFSSTGTGGNPLRVPGELLQDSMFDVEGRILAKLGQRIARHAAPLFVSGNGAGQPQGIVDGCTSANGRAIELNDDTDGVTFNDLVEFEHSVDPAYREMEGVGWAMNDASVKYIKKLTDSNGDPLWLPVTNDRIGVSLFRGTLLGYPVTIDQGFDDIDVDDITDMWGVFGNLREALTVRVVGAPVVIRDPYSRKSYNQIEFVAHQRMDSVQNDIYSYVALTGEEA